MKMKFSALAAAPAAAAPARAQMGDPSKVTLKTTPVTVPDKAHGKRHAK